ncbi:Fe-S cluster biosynthesis protein ISA1 (contains a HesB-like domain) [Handroanthus impetiginosus]|uniref:Fe-S cluster biosynthesis protein ISA1 (Contains a HesB-like domain) n=1 Tax=Handroanthus impetiginosus TaxID=429701 RepID=A0A2G9H6J7_9LAMI|nr:Fe-S cluster biosynthesis protein ISA1 (contains a HesB-like domain) [Handroanthus impetiginosus]
MPGGGGLEQTMAFSQTLQSPCFSSLRKSSSPALLSSLASSSSPSSSVSFRFSPSFFNRKKPLLSIRSASVEAPSTAGGLVPGIALTDNALRHLNKMRAERSEDLCLRIGVKQGGCSGLSYTMEFESKENSRPDDSVMEYNGFVIVCDPKSLLFLYGMQLDYSDALIGGGFNFKNPNATQTCGCGKSFAAEM